MKFDGFEIHAEPYLNDAYCECGEKLHEVSNGWISRAFFCAKCENVYLIKKVKVPKKKITKEFLQQCKFEIKFQEEKFKLRKKLEKEFDI